MLRDGDRIPDVTLYSAPGQAASMLELASAGKTLFLFYLFDWSST